MNRSARLLILSLCLSASGAGAEEARVSFEDPDILVVDMPEAEMRAAYPGADRGVMAMSSGYLSELVRTGGEALACLAYPDGRVVAARVRASDGASRDAGNAEGERHLCGLLLGTSDGPDA